MSVIERLITKSNPRAISWIFVVLVLGAVALMGFSYSGSITATAGSTFGYGVGRIQVGDFEADGLGSFKAYINNVNRPLLFIKTKSQSYLLSPDDAWALKLTIDQAKAK